MRLKDSPVKLPKREIELDFIRGIAILMVLDFHSPREVLLAPFRWLGFSNFGWSGVDIFFVLSGFLVGGLLVKEWRLRGRIDSKQFLIRRGFKIWPQYYFFILCMLVTGHRSASDLWGNLLNIQNYVGGVAHTWTLAVEEHAYLLLAFCLAFAAYRGVRMRHVFFALAAVSAAVLALRFVLTSQGYNTFTRTDTRIDGIFYGVMLAILYHYAPELFRRLQRLSWVWGGIILLALADFRFGPKTNMGGAVSWLCADAMGVACLLLLYHHDPVKKRPLVFRLIAWIGLYSYGIYLWHVSVVAPVISLGRHLRPGAEMFWEAVASPLLGIALGVLTTKLIEFPSLKLRDRLFPRRVDSAVGIPAEIEERDLVQQA
jgi:peptidoglycan/LPS O-acetylase OafA/YrhL